MTINHHPLLDLLNERILVLDGAMGTSLQQLNLTADDFGGIEYEGCNENLILTRPDVIQQIHNDFLSAGADLIETNSFGSCPVVLAEYGLQEKAFEISQKSAELAKKSAESFSTPDRPRFVAGSMGPTTKAISVTGGITFEELIENYSLWTEGLIAGGSDCLLIETTQDTLNLKAALIGVQNTFEKLEKILPVMVSITIEPTGTMLGGQSVEALYTSIEHFPLLSVGLNCATGPDFMTDHLRTLSGISKFGVSCVPNAGLPDEEGQYPETAEGLASKLERFADQGWLNLVGGCCGTTPEHIKQIVQMVDGKTPRIISAPKRTIVSGIESFLIDDEKRPVLVGERTNVIGSRKFKRLIKEGNLESAAEIGRQQVRSGAQIIDVCLADPDREEVDDMNRFIQQLVKKTKAPLMIDSTDMEVMEIGLKWSQGKSILNSINLEDGEERFEKAASLIKKYGAAVVVGLIDETGMAVSRIRKQEIAERSYRLLTEKHSIPEEDIIFDLLTFPVGTGDENYVGSAEETIEAIRSIKETFPNCKIILGVSNVSFGLPPAGREVLNSVFLHHCVKAGLDLAIVNSEKIQRYASISDEEKGVADDLLFFRIDDPVNVFADHFRERKVVSQAERDELPLKERLARYIIEGSKEGLTGDLDKALKEQAPLEIINGPLMDGMAEVGRLFNNNELIVAEVLQSAEAMKAAVTHLEPLMDKSETSTKGKILLATVKGDVHDIGKNLVDIILTNNGFEVVNLGIKVPPEVLIAEHEKHQPDFIGLSGLLVKSAQQMTITASDLKNAGIQCTILVGGAALSKKFADTKIAANYDGQILYAKDAMDGLALAQSNGAEYKQMTAEMKTPAPANSSETKPTIPIEEEEVVPLSYDYEVPAPPDFEPHVLDGNVKEIFTYLNYTVLYSRHLGLQGSMDRLLMEGDDTATQLKEKVDGVLDRISGEGWLKPKGIYQYFNAQSDGNDLVLFNPSGQELERFQFERQSKKPSLCISDFVAPKSSGKMDVIAMFVVSCGEGVRQRAEELKEDGSYFLSHTFQAVALECAEGFAEQLHKKIRNELGIADPDSLTNQDCFKAKYRGVRFSFGYPACPRLEDQEKLFDLLKVSDRIPVELTDGYMMDPEASVSAIVFHHPAGRYFSL